MIRLCKPPSIILLSWLQLCRILVSVLSLSQEKSTTILPNIRAAVIVPGFLTGADEFRSLTQSLTERGIPTVAVPMSNWHWLSCLGGRSMRPVLERLDVAVRHVASGNVDNLPNIGYSAADLWSDFISNPGGILKVGGSWDVEDYPVVAPAGDFGVEANPPIGRIALIGHSAGGWISRIYLSERDYGGRCYDGSLLVHSLVTLGTPHASAPGPAFAGIRWCNRDVINASVRQLAVGGTGFAGGEWGALTQGSYAFCCNEGTDGTSYDGDGVTPIQSALGWEGAKTMIIPGTTHFCWSDVFGGNLVAAELTKDHAAGRSWYGSDCVVDQWAKWLVDSGN